MLWAAVFVVGVVVVVFVVLFWVYFLHPAHLRCPPSVLLYIWHILAVVGAVRGACG